MKNRILVMRYSIHNQSGSIIGVASSEPNAREMEEADFKDYLELGCKGVDYEPSYQRFDLPEIDQRISMF